MTFMEYRNRTTQFGLRERFDKDGLIDILKWLHDDSINIYREEFLSLLNRTRLPNRNTDQLIEQAIPKNINEWQRKYYDPNYYISNAIIFTDICRWVAETTLDSLNQMESKEIDIVIYNYSHLIHYMLMDSLVLLSNYKINITQESDQSKLYGVGKSPIQHTMGYWQFIRQVIFGQESFHSFIDREVDMSIGMIRMAVEIRLRRGFGILGKIKKDEFSVHPLPVEHLLECMKIHQASIEIAVPVNILIRIYGWSNIFVHAGIKDYTWLPIKMCLYLRDFLVGKRTNGWSVNNGIKMDSATLKNIQDCIRSKINQDVYDLWEIGKVDSIIV